MKKFIVVALLVVLVLMPVFIGCQKKGPVVGGGG